MSEEGVINRTVSLIDNGRVVRSLGKKTEALACFDKAVAICRPHAANSDPAALSLSQALDNKANALLDLGRPSKAIPLFEEAIQIQEEIRRGDGTSNELRGTAISIINKGRALMLAERNDEALQCFNDAGNIFMVHGGLEDVALALVNSGDLHFRLGQFEKALASLDASVAAWQHATAFEDERSKSNLAYTLYSKADALLYLGRWHEALGAIDRAVAIQRAIADFTNHQEDRKDLDDCLRLRNAILGRLEADEEDEQCG